MPVNPYVPTGSGVLKTEILIDNKNNGLDGLMLEAEVNFELNKIPSARFTFVASNLDNNNGTTMESDSLALNSEIEFSVFVNDQKKTLYKGIIKSIEKKQLATRITIKIECRDKAFKMTFNPPETETNELTFDDHLEAAANGLTIDSSLTGQEWGQEKISRNPATLPWDFILAYLDSAGIMMAARNGELKGIDITQTATEKYNAENGINIFSFSGKTDNTKLFKKVSVEYWDPASQSIQKTEAEQEAEYENNKIIRLNENRFSQGTITRVANAALKKSALSAIYGHVLTFGNLEAFAGDYMLCNKVHPEIDNKPVIIWREHHIIEKGIWKTEYTFGLENVNNFSDSVNPQLQNPQVQLGQSNLVPGLQIGTVIQIEEDPLNEFRIKVRIPAMAETGEGVWARLANIYGSSETGSFFIPDVDDEVILGCLGNNPDNPVILGSLYSSAHVPPFTVTADNFIKGFVTKGGNKIVIDDEKKVIELSTEKGNKLLISDELKGLSLEDENKNKILMNKDGITIESSKDIIMKAKGNFQAEAKEFKIKASGNLEMKGSMIKLN